MRASVGSPLGAARCRVRPLQGLQPESSSSVGAAGASWLRACGGARMPRHAAGDADARMVHARRSCGAHAAHSRAAAGWLLAACLRLRSHLVRADAARASLHRAIACRLAATSRHSRCSLQGRLAVVQVHFRHEVRDAAGVVAACLPLPSRWTCPPSRFSWISAPLMRSLASIRWARGPTPSSPAATRPALAPVLPSPAPAGLFNPSD